MRGDGREWIVDARGCEPAALADLRTLRALLQRAIDELDLRAVAEPLWHVFPPPGGITGLVLLAESHLAVHTFPEHGALCLNLFCCTARTEWDFAGRLREAVGATDVKVRRVDREYLPARAPVSAV
ncbi:MAG: S-adenosylmethionine decarboxylase family protein [Gemmatimonadales bacterium]